MTTEFNELNNIVPSSRDGKVLLPAIINSFQSLQEQLFESFRSMLDGKFDEFKRDFTSMFKEKNDLIDAMKCEMDGLKQRVSKLEENIDNQDAYERRDTLVFSGKCLPQPKNIENCSQIIIDTVREKLQINLDPNDISVAHRYGAKNASQRPDNRGIIIKLCRRDTKVALVSASRNLKPSDLFINECLTPLRQTIAYVLRKAKREFPTIISGTSTLDGKNFVWVKPPNSAAAGAKDFRHGINSHARLVEFCKKTLDRPLNHFITEWNH